LSIVFVHFRAPLHWKNIPRNDISGDTPEIAALSELREIWFIGENLSSSIERSIAVPKQV
jgi:hypothetical protein